jgi:hypothetical protein
VWVEGNRLVHKGVVRNMPRENVVADARREVHRLLGRL